MYSWTGLSGIITPHPGMGILVKGIYVDYTTVAPETVYISVSGSFGNEEHTYSIFPPNEVNFRYSNDETVKVASIDPSGQIQTITVNYIFYGDQNMYMQADPGRVHTHVVNKWHP